LISIDYSVLLQAANFLALVFILHILLIKPISKALTQREHTINQAEAKSRKLAEELSLRRQELETRREKAQAQATQVRNDLLAEAKTQAARMIDTARQAADEMTARLEKEREIALKETLSALNAQREILSQAIAAKLLGRPLP
jgi:F-type H+-transporting ATPase subunit b